MTRQLSGSRKQQLFLAAGAALGLAALLVVASLGVPTGVFHQADTLVTPSGELLPEAVLLSAGKGTRYFHTLDLSGTAFTQVKAITRAELQIHIALAAGTLPLVLQTTIGAVTADAALDGARLAAWPIAATPQPPISGIASDQIVTVDVLEAIKRYAGGEVTFVIATTGAGGSELAASSGFIDLGDISSNGVRIDPSGITLSYDTQACESGCTGTPLACSAIGTQSQCQAHDATSAADMGCEWKTGGVCSGTYSATCAALPAASCPATSGLLAGRCELAPSSCSGTLNGCSGRAQNSCSGAPCSWVGDSCTAKTNCTGLSGASCDAVAATCLYTGATTTYGSKPGATCGSVYAANGDCGFGCQGSGASCSAGTPQACPAITGDTQNACTQHNCAYTASVCAPSSGPDCSQFAVNGNADNCSPHRAEGCAPVTSACTGTYDSCSGSGACSDETDPKYCSVGGCAPSYYDDCGTVKTTDPKLAAAECDKYCGGAVAAGCQVNPKFCAGFGNIDLCQNNKASCAWDGKQCVPWSGSTTCSIYSTSTDCARQPSACLWSSVYTCKNTKPVTCAAADANGCQFHCTGTRFDCSAFPPSVCQTQVRGCVDTTGLDCNANGCPASTSGGDTTACVQPTLSCGGTYTCSSVCNGDSLCTYATSASHCDGSNPQCTAASNPYPTCTSSDAYCSYSANASSCSGSPNGCSAQSFNADYCTSSTTASSCAQPTCQAGSCNGTYCIDSGNYCSGSSYGGCSDARLQNDNAACSNGGCSFTNSACRQASGVGAASCGDARNQASCDAEQANGCVFQAAGCAKRQDFVCASVKDQTTCVQAPGCNWAAPCPVNTAPMLSNAMVTPPQGASGAVFAFQVTYHDAEGHAPRPGMPTLAIFLNGTAVGGIRETTATGTSDNFTSGVTFTTSVALDTPGTYHFCFDATDGPGLAAAQLCADAPIVVALLDAVAGPLAPGSGAKGEGQVKYSGQGVMSQWKCSSGAPNAIDLAFVCIGCAWALRRKRRD